jgi:hypothetical protein
MDSIPCTAPHAKQGLGSALGTNASRRALAATNSCLMDRVTAMELELVYKEYRIVPMPRAGGWQALIYAPGSHRHLPESPSTRDPVGRTSVIDAARLVVDRLCIQAERRQTASIC